MTPTLRFVLAAALIGLVVAFGGCQGPTPSNNEDPTVTAAPTELRSYRLEIDQMEGTEDLLVEQEIGGQQVSLARIYRDAGIILRIEVDRTDLPSTATVRVADLHALMTEHRQQGDNSIYVLVVTEDEEDPDTLGIMFDFGQLDVNGIPRESFAVFASAHAGLTGARAELLLTSAHELAHVFNLHHTDWEGDGFDQGGTIESYSFSDSVRWRLSESSVRHLRSHHQRLVWPGPQSLSFAMVTQAHHDDHQDTPLEDYEIVDPERDPSARRGPTISRQIATRGSFVRERSGSLSQEVALHLHLPKTIFALGEAISPEVELHNESGAVVQIPRLEPEFGFVSYAVRAPGSSDFVPFRPAVHKSARRGFRRELESGTSVGAVAKLFFGAEGWRFSEPGEYVLRVDVPITAADGTHSYASAEKTLTVSPQTAGPAARAARALRAPDGQSLGTNQGLYLLFGGGDHLDRDGTLRRIVEEEPDAPQSASIRLALAKQSLQPTYDPSRRGRPESDPEKARQYLEGIASGLIGERALLTAKAAVVGKLEEMGKSSEALELYRDTKRRLDSILLEPARQKDLTMLLDARGKKGALPEG